MNYNIIENFLDKELFEKFKTEIFSGLWYKEKDVIEHVERILHFAKGE